MKRWIKLLGLLLGLAATAAFIVYAHRALQGQDLSIYTTPAALRGLVLCTLLYILSLPLAAMAWRKLLAWQGVEKPTPELTRIMAVSQIGKYVPGNIGAHVGRGFLGHAAGIPMKALSFALLAEAGLVAYVGVAVGIIAMGWFAMAKVGITPFILVLGLLCVPFLMSRISPSQRLIPPVGIIAPAALAYVLLFGLIALGLWCLAAHLLPDHAPSFPLLCAVFSLSWVAGFFTPGAPAGMGVREVAMLAMLQGHSGLSEPAALSLIIGFRLATVAGDAILFLLGSLGWLLHSPYKPPCTPHKP